jgi:polysaccharide biosynthesis protein PslG
VLFLVALAAATLAACDTGRGSAGLAVGVQFHGLWSSYTDADRLAALDTLAGAGLTRVRIDASWAMLQPDGPDSYDPGGVERLDKLVAMSAERGMRPLITLWLTPEWAGGDSDGRVLPTDPSDYARAAGWAARRWAGQVDWEIWNEPNAEEFLAGASAQHYAELLRAAYPAIKAADPSALVVAGSLQYNDTGWLRQIYDAGAGGHFDVLSTHPYQSPADLPPEAADDGSIHRLTHAGAVHQLMTEYGDGSKPVWFTELGWSTAPGGVDPWTRSVTPEQQADYLVRALDLIERTMPFVPAVFIYRDRDAAEVEDHVDGFGLLTYDLHPKPALEALRRRQAELSDR